MASRFTTLSQKNASSKETVIFFYLASVYEALLLPAMSQGWGINSSKTKVPGPVQHTLHWETEQDVHTVRRSELLRKDKTEESLRGWTTEEDQGSLHWKDLKEGGSRAQGYTGGK